MPSRTKKEIKRSIAWKMKMAALKASRKAIQEAIRQNYEQEQTYSQNSRDKRRTIATHLGRMVVIRRELDALIEDCS